MADEDRSPMPLADAFREMEEESQRGQADEQQDSRPNNSGGLTDPFDRVDPWNDYNDGTGLDMEPEQANIIAPAADRRQFAGAVTHPGPGTYEGNPRKMMHDVPPEWDGMDPQKNLEPYLKLLQGWLATTATIPHQRGLISMN